MYRVGNKILRIGNQLPYSVNNTVLEFTVMGSSFPDRMGGGVQIGTSGLFTENLMYIDYADGTGVHEYSFLSGTYSFASNSILHYYQNLADPTKVGTVSPTYMEERRIKIWFKFPQRINVLSWQNFGLYGELPKNIQNYNWSVQLRFANMYNLNNFPAALGGLKAAILNLSNLSSVKLNYLPAWIKNSNIPSLTLQQIFNFAGADSATTGFDGLGDIKNLNTLDIADNNLITNAEFPVLNNCATLRTLRIGNPFSVFPAKIGECAQVTNLEVSNGVNGRISPNFNDWGAGIGLMTALITLTVQYTNNVPTTVPTGMASCVNLKNLNYGGLFLDQARSDDFVNNFYDFIVANASTSVGNTKFRQMVVNYADSSVRRNLRPTGNYADEDSPMGKIYRMVTIYKHTWTVRNAANTANQTYS